MISKHLSSAVELHKQGKFKKAAQTLKKVKSTEFEVLKLHMQINYDLTNFLLAASYGEQILKQKISIEQKKEIYFFVGICFSKALQKPKAIEFLEKSVALDSSVVNAGALFNLLCLYYQLEQLTKVEQLALKLLSWEKYFVKVTYLLAKCAAKTDNKAVLQKRAKSLSTYFSEFNEEMFGDVVGFLIATGLYTDAEKLIVDIEKLHKLDATSLRADLLFANKKYREVIDYLSEEKLMKVGGAKLYYKKAMTHDKLKRFDDAYLLFEQAAKEKKRETKNLPVKNYLPLLNKVTDKVTVKCTTDIYEALSEKTPKKLPDLVFVFGFPRSGTTLLDNILDTQEGALVLSEKGMMSHVIKAFSLFDKKYPQDLVNLSNGEIDVLRGIYFDAIEYKGYSIENRQVIVDKGPHHTEALPLIVKIFPQAKLIATIRHPLDVCLSCFQQDFEFNQHNAFLITMDDTVKRYNQVFNLLERYESEMNIEVKSIKYEDLVTDFDTVMLDLFSYIGLNPNDAYKNFHKHASTKYVTSASRGQTEQALYKTSTYRWKNYRNQLEPCIEPLSYFINKYGYKT